MSSELPAHRSRLIAPTPKPRTPRLRAPPKTQKPKPVQAAPRSGTTSRSAESSTSTFDFNRRESRLSTGAAAPKAPRHAFRFPPVAFHYFFAIPVSLTCEFSPHRRNVLPPRTRCVLAVRCRPSFGVQVRTLKPIPRAHFRRLRQLSAST